jgi:hypothetical protein
MYFDHGEITWLAAHTVGTTYTVSGLSYKPKAILFFAPGINSFGAGAQDLHGVMGFATTTSNRGCACTFSQNAAGTSVCANIVSTDSIYRVASGNGALDINAFNSDGFQLIVDTQSSAIHVVQWMAFGGADITDAEVFTIAEPATATTVKTTLTGAFKPNVVILAFSKPTALDTVTSNDAALSIGFMTSTSASNNICVMGNSDTGSASMDTDGYGIAAECAALIADGGAAVCNMRAVLSSFDTDGFTLNFLERAVTNRRGVGIAIKGGQWQASSYTINTTTVGNTTTVSGLSFRPIGALHISREATQSTSDATTAHNKVSIGCWSSTSSRRAIGWYDVDSPTTSDIGQVQDTGGGGSPQQILALYDNSTGGVNLHDINAVNADGFQVIVDSNSLISNAAIWHGYLAFGTDSLMPLGVVRPMFYSRPKLRKI